MRPSTSIAVRLLSALVGRKVLLLASISLAYLENATWDFGVTSLHGTQNHNKCTPFREKFQIDDLITQHPLGNKLKPQRIWNPGGAPSSNPLSFQFVP